MKKLIILGSSRRDGDTKKITNHLQSKHDMDIIDLQDYKISYYDYNHANKDDDFIPLMKKIIANYDTLIFATPIYWYSMSAIMKTFFDRISDLLTIEKELGRQLRGKSMAMISCSGHDDRDPQFGKPFTLTADYLGMKYLGDTHTWVIDESEISSESFGRMDDFLEKLNSHL